MIQTLSGSQSKLLEGLSETEKQKFITKTAALKKEWARAGLIDFASYIDPTAKRWYQAAHLRLIAGILEQVERGELQNVIINIPPRHWKSSITSEKFAAWYLGKHPDHPIIGASNAATLAEKYSRSVRDTVQYNERFKALFPEVRLRKDAGGVADWVLEQGHRSTYRAVGTGGAIPGFGFKLALLDDVSDPNKQESETETENNWQWFKNVLVPRAEPDAAIVVVNNRTGPNDVTGYLTDPERNDSRFPADVWTVVNMQAQDEGTGEYLWLDRFGLDYYESLQNDPYLWKIQFQQQTGDAEGTEIKREWFEVVAQLPEGVREQKRVIDTAWTLKKTEKQDPDFTASISSAKHGGWLYLVDPFEQRQTMPDTVDWIKAKKKEKPYVRFGMAKAAGEQIATQFLTRLGIPIVELTAEKVDLRVRLGVFIYWARNGRVKLVGDVKKWERFLAQAAAFPNGKHDDLLAVCAGLTEMYGLKIDVPQVQGKPELSLFEQVKKQYRQGARR